MVVNKKVLIAAGLFVGALAVLDVVQMFQIANLNEHLAYAQDDAIRALHTAESASESADSLDRRLDRAEIATY